MNDDSLDVLTAMYRREARETPSPEVDARILHVSERTIGTNPWMWRALALAASVLLAVGLFATRPRESPRAEAGNPMAGYDEGRAAAYLMQAELPIPRSLVAESLLTIGRADAPRSYPSAHTEK